MKLKDKVVIVTGSSQGIGKAVALLMAREGANVVINGRNPDKLQITGKEFLDQNLNFLPVQADVGDYAACERLIQETLNAYGRLDILVNNAGISMEGKIETTDPQVFAKVFHTNILGQLYPTKAALPYIKQNKGSIIFISSIAGLIGLPRYSAYSSSKMALTALVQSLRIETQTTGIHIGINYLGFVENDAAKTFYDEQGRLQPMPERRGFAKMTSERAAEKIVSNIIKKRKQVIFSPLGQVMAKTQQLFPRIFDKLMTRSYKKQQSDSL
jgi:short-subunit dehydrogenase